MDAEHWVSCLFPEETHWDLSENGMRFPSSGPQAGKGTGDQAADAAQTLGLTLWIDTLALGF